MTFSDLRKVLQTSETSAYSSSISIWKKVLLNDALCKQHYAFIIIFIHFVNNENGINNYFFCFPKLDIITLHIIQYVWICFQYGLKGWQDWICLKLEKYDYMNKSTIMLSISYNIWLLYYRVEHVLNAHADDVCSHLADCVNKVFDVLTILVSCTHWCMILHEICSLLRDCPVWC